jgi:lysozyme family protein
VARFEVCADALLEAHGGVVYRDSALRGPCMNGISLGMLSAFLGEPASIGRLMRLDEALTRRIYRRLIWDELGADRLPPGLDLALLAFAVEAGPHAAILALQDALGVPFSPIAWRWVNCRAALWNNCATRRLKWPGQTDLCCQAIRAHRT